MMMQVTYLAPLNANWASPNGPDNVYLNNNGQLMTYVCPDKLVDYPVSNYTAGSKLSLSHWAIPRVFAGVNMKSSSDGDATGNGVTAIETKYFEIAAAEATPDPDPNKEILAIQDVAEGASITNFGPGNWSYYNQQGFNGAPSAVDGACNAFAINIANSGSNGGNRSVVEIDGSFWSYNQYNVVNYGDVLNTSDNKIIANVTVSKSSLYGGQTPEALANTFYISVGHFQPITAAVKTDTFDGVDKYIFDGIEIWGGDCYNCLITYGHSLAGVGLFNSVPPPIPTNSWAIKFACQCNSNYDLRRGNLPEAIRMYPAAAGLVYNVAAVTPILEGFSYNKGYSSTGLSFLYPSLPVNFSTTGNFPFRVRYAGQKFIGEAIDSFRRFGVLDFKDMDGHGGEINNLKTKDGRTIAWQQLIVSAIPILERIINTSAEGAPTQLGTGGVADRFDPISSYFGNQHQWSLVETEYGFAWFDMHRKAYTVLDLNGGGIIEVSQVNGLKGYFDELFLEVLGNTSPTANVVNSQTFAATSDRPLLNVGITSAYDPKFKMTYVTIKFYTREVVPTDKVSNIAKDITIGYYHPRKMFVGLFDWTPAISHTHNQTLFSVKNPQMKTRYYGVDMASTAFEVGDIVKYLNSEYICIADVTIASYPGTAGQIPDAVASAYWYKINQTNEIWAHNQPKLLGQNPAPDYLYSSFFGQVVDGEVWVPVLADTDNAVSVLNIEQHGNNENVTSIYTETGYDSASDINISSTNRFYKWVYDRICSSLPLSSKGVRLTDAYLLIKFVKKNWSTVPYTVSRLPKIFERLISYWEEKR